MAQPTIDGNLDDIVTFGQGNPNFCSTDVSDIDQPQCNSLGFEPCTVPNPGAPFYFQNGFDLTRSVTVYDKVNRKLYLGIRVAGFIGDTDGNGDPDNACGVQCTNPNCGGISDNTGINGSFDGDFYQWALNLNCAGAPDALIKITGDDPVNNASHRTLIGLGAGAHIVAMVYRGGSATGHDIEVEVDDVDLVPPYQVEGKAGSSAECLGEDASPLGACTLTPNIAINKTADVDRLCPGQVATFTVVVTNSGQIDFKNQTIAGQAFAGRTDLIDVIPPGLEYVANSAQNNCGAGDPAVSGNQLSWSFPLDAGASCTFTFQARARQECFGVATNVATATGFFRHPCIGAGTEQVIGPATDDATITCVQAPCVQVSCRTDVTSQCPGKPVVVTATATNCSLSPETITITIEGQDFNCGVIQPNESCERSRTINMPDCTAGNDVTFHTSATGTNECAPPDTKPSDCNVRCLAPPSVALSLQCEPAKACPGQTITLTATATNDGTGNENVTITIAGEDFSCGSLAPNETCTRTKTVTMPACDDGENVPFAASTKATTDCGEDTDSKTCSVECQGAEILVTKTSVPASGSDVSQGDVIHYSIEVKNPSSDVTLTGVTISDQFQEAYADNATPTPDTEPAVGTVGGTVTWTLASLAPGATATFTFDVTVRTLDPCDSRDVVNSVTASGSCFDSDASRTSTTTHHVVCEGLCRLTGGGCLNEKGGHRGHKQHTFGGNSSPAHDDGGPTGNEWEHHVRDGKTECFNFHSHDAHVVNCTVVPPGPCSPDATNTKADFEGTGTYSGDPNKCDGSGPRDREATFTAYIIDHKEGECNRNTRDEYFIRVVDAQTQQVVFTVTGEIDCGNFQIHETPAKIFGSGIRTDGPGSLDVATVTGGDGVTLLNQVIPNPFSGTMSYSYRVPPGGGKPVEIGTYDIAGRLVRKLASGTQSAGQYTVKWDGRDDAGTRMDAGIYFLRARVGDAEDVTRVIYLRP